MDVSKYENGNNFEWGIGKIFGRAFSGEKMFQNVYTAQGGEGMIAFCFMLPGIHQGI